MTTVKTIEEAQERFDALLPETRDGNEHGTTWVDPKKFRAAFDDVWAPVNVGELTDSWGSRTINHTGWYIDDQYDRTIYGFIVEIELDDEIEDEDGYIEQDASIVYVAGAAQSDSDTEWVLPEIHDDRVDAIYAADGLADALAESEREYHEAYNKGFEAAQRLAEGRAKIETALDMVRAGDTKSEGAQSTIAELLEEGRDLRREGWNIKDEYGPSSYGGWRSEDRAEVLTGAWKEGFTNGLVW